MISQPAGILLKKAIISLRGRDVAMRPVKHPALPANKEYCCMSAAHSAFEFIRWGVDAGNAIDAKQQRLHAPDQRDHTGYANSFARVVVTANAFSFFCRSTVFKRIFGRFGPSWLSATR